MPNFANYYFKRWVISWGMLAMLTGCVGMQTTDKTDIESYIGLYEIINPQCDMSIPCNRFFEIVKGQFIGVEDDELAYVFWSGDPTIDPELQYTAHLLRNHSLRSISHNKYVLIEEKGAQEYVVFSRGKLTGYRSEYARDDRFKGHSIYYQLNSIRRGDLPSVRLNYPGK